MGFIIVNILRSRENAGPAITPVGSISTLNPAQPVRISTEISPKGEISTTPYALNNYAHYMLQLINEDRQNNGLRPVEWDHTAAQIGRLHAEDMAQLGYFSHWNTNGYGPDMRYAISGGRDVVQENLYSYWYHFSSGTPAPITNWEQLIQDAQISLMNSPGHRANILDPAHTHVGIGIAYNPKTGEVRLAQEFLNRYVALSEIPLEAKKGQEIRVAGVLLLGAHDPIINVAFEPSPKPLSIWDLNNTVPHTYESVAKNIQAIAPDSFDSAFSALVNVGAQGAGFYHIRIWVTQAGTQVMAAEIIVAVL